MWRRLHKLWHRLWAGLDDDQSFALAFYITKIPISADFQLDEELHKECQYVVVFMSHPREPCIGAADIFHRRTTADVLLPTVKLSGLVI